MEITHICKKRTFFLPNLMKTAKSHGHFFKIESLQQQIFPRFVICFTIRGNLTKSLVLTLKVSYDRL